MTELIIASIMTMMTAATPLMFAATGELICERSGVLNLGLEGMMLIGAVFGFAAAAVTGNATLGLLVAATSGAFAALIFLWHPDAQPAFEPGCNRSGLDHLRHRPLGVGRS